MCNFGFQPEALNRAFLDIFEELLVLQNFFFAKLLPGTAKTVFAYPKGPSPLRMLKKKIFRSKFYQSHVMAFGIMIPKWYRLCGWGLSLDSITLLILDSRSNS